MKIELKRIQFSERMSEETNCFMADLYINGKKAGECKNDGQGGSTNYWGLERYSTDIIKEAEAYCKTLPRVKYHDMEWEQSLEGVIDELLEAYLKAKEDKKSEKKMEKEIRFGVPNAPTYRYLTWKGRTLSQVPLPVLQAKVDEIRAKYCKDGVVILNTNLQKLGVI